MQANRLIVLLFMACLTGCRQPQPDQEKKTALPEQAVWADPRPACPSQQFDAFLVAFIANSEIQEHFTAVPLQHDSIDAGAEPEPVTITRMLQFPELTFPVMHTEQEQRAQGLTLSTKRVGADAVVTVAKPDTDYQISYYFRQGKGCWELYRKHDESI